LGQKADFIGKNRTNLRAFFQKCPLSDQGLIKQTYLAALAGLSRRLLWVDVSSANQQRLRKTFPLNCILSYSLQLK
jgi:hypothetical protein